MSYVHWTDQFPECNIPTITLLQQTLENLSKKSIKHNKNTNLADKALKFNKYLLASFNLFEFQVLTHDLDNLFLILFLRSQITYRVFIRFVIEHK